VKIEYLYLPKPNRFTRSMQLFGTVDLHKVIQLPLPFPPRHYDPPHSIPVWRKTAGTGPVLVRCRLVVESQGRQFLSGAFKSSSTINL